MASSQSYTHSSHQIESNSINFSSRANPYNNVCDQCYRRKLSCSRGSPECERCRHSGQQCTYSVTRPVGRPKRLEPYESRHHRRSVVRNAMTIHEQALQRKELYTPVSQDPRNSQASLLSNQKEEIRREHLGAQTEDDSNHSESTLFHSDLDTALQSLNYSSQANEAYQNHPTRSGENIKNSSAERHGHTSAQLNNAQAISEPAVATNLDCDVLTPSSPALDEEFLDFNFSNQERFYVNLEPEHSNPTSIISEDKCHCLLYIMQSLDRNRQEKHTRWEPMSRLHLLNEAAEQFLMCDNNHGKLWYVVLLALYQDTDDSLRLPEELQEMVSRQPKAKESHDDRKSSLNMNAKKRNILLKTFILLSSTASVLPFRFRTNADDKFSPEITEAFARLVRDRFEHRLLEQTGEASQRR